MKPFYSIVYVPIRPEVKEILTLGLLMRDEKQVIFRYSKNKLSIIKELLPKEAYHLLKLSLQSIERAAINASEDFDYTLSSLLPDKEISSSMVAEPYIKYLSSYSKNLISFTTPEHISAPVTFELFKLLFSKLIAEDVSEKNIASADIVLKTKEILLPKIKDRVNIDFKVTTSLFKKLILPSITVDFIGKNDVYVTGQLVNFEKKEYALEAEITKQFALINAMRSKSNGSKCFIIGKEPDKKEYQLQHTFWKNIRQDNSFDFIDADENEQVAEYLRSHNVQPISPKE